MTAFLILAVPAMCGLAYVLACAITALEDRADARFWRGVLRGLHRARRAER